MTPETRASMRALGFNTMTRLAPARAGTESAENIAAKIQRAPIAATQGRVLRFVLRLELELERFGAPEVSEGDDINDVNKMAA